MAVESLQDLASEVVTDRVTLDAIHYVYIALVTLVSSALGAYFGAYFKRRGEEQAIKDSFDDVINRLGKTTKITEDIKSAIGINTLEYQIKFSKLHEKRIQIIEGLYQRLVDMETLGKEYIYKSSPTNFPQAEFISARDSIDRFISYSKLNVFWVDEELFNEIEKVALSLDKAIYGTSFQSDIGVQNTAALTKAMNENKKIMEKITQDIPAAREKVIKSIRMALDPKQK